MFARGRRFVWIALPALSAIVATCAWGRGAAAAETPPELVAARAEPTVERIVEHLDQPALRELVEDVLSRNPEIAAAQARARAASLRAPQARALPDPVASLTAFLETPETRTGPQRLSVGLSQGLPWAGKRSLREQAALWTAAVLEARVDVERLRLITETRRLYHELAFLDRSREITEEFRAHLLQHEEISRARYSTGVGLGQAVVKLQAEITRVEKELLGVDTRRATLLAELNGLRDRAAATPVPFGSQTEAVEVALDHDALLAAASVLRPEVVAARAGVARAATLVRLAEKGYRPDFRVGLTYTLVDSRDDAAGRLQPPAGNGDDIFGIQGGVTLPVWRKKLAAAVDEARALELAENESQRAVMARIKTRIGDLTQRVPLAWRQLRLVKDLLIVQAEEAVDSAQAAYVVGNLNALDLLDAEHVLFEAHTAVARAETDYLVGLARLEGAAGKPLRHNTTWE